MLGEGLMVFLKDLASETASDSLAFSMHSSRRNSSFIPSAPAITVFSLISFLLFNLHLFLLHIVIRLAPLIPPLSQLRLQSISQETFMMQLHSLLLAILLATFVAAKGDKSISEKSQCKQMRKLEKFVTLASNTTKLEQVTKNNATKVAELQTEASAAAQKLSTMQTNATLIANCAVINAQAEEENQCEETFALQQFITFAANTTAVAAKTDNNATKIAALQAKASQATAKLQTLTSNSTLQAACPAVLQKDECKAMMKLQKFITKANNATRLDKASKGKSTKADKIKAQAVKAQTQLTEWQNNKTFMAACDALGMTNTGKGIDSGASTEQAATTGKSAATMMGASIQLTMLSTVLVVAAGMFWM